MTIQVNGERIECDDALTVAEFIGRRQLLGATTLVELNGTALHRRDWPGKRLRENDRLEILQVAAGG